jgi:hypothetical protein
VKFVLHNDDLELRRERAPATELVVSGHHDPASGDGLRLAAVHVFGRAADVVVNESLRCPVPDLDSEAVGAGRVQTVTVPGREQESEAGRAVYLTSAAAFSGDR